MEKTDKKPTQKEIEEKRGRIREIALKNLKESKLSDLAVAYFAHSDKNYGEHDNGAVEEFLYFPALNSGTSYYDPESGKKTDLLKDSLISSRQDGKRYSGQVSEHETIKTAATIIQQSLGAIKVDDIMDLIGSYVKIKENYKGKYISDLAQSKNEEDQKIAMGLIDGYVQYQTIKKVSKALGQRTENIKGGLEELVKREE